MIFITNKIVRSNINFLSGILLEEFADKDMSKDAFKAFLVSDKIRKILCERPTYIGGHGTNSEGLLINEVESKLCGPCTYLFSLSEISDLSTGVENRTELVTNSDVESAVFPAFLTTRETSRPKRLRVIVKMNITRLIDFPDFQAFVLREKYLLKDPQIQKFPSMGTKIPLKYVSGGKTQVAALEFVRKFEESFVEAVIYYPEGSPAPLPGDTLERRVSVRENKKSDKHVELSARIGFISSILN